MFVVTQTMGSLGQRLALWEVQGYVHHLKQFPDPTRGGQPLAPSLILSCVSLSDADTSLLRIVAFWPCP